MSVTVRYYAGARAAAGVAEERAAAGPLAGVRDEVLARHDDRFARVLAACTWRSDGRNLSEDAVVADDAVIEVLPPFAGG